MKPQNIICASLVLLFAGKSFLWTQTVQHTFPVVDTGQQVFFDTSGEINAPTAGQAFYGQDARYAGRRPDYTDNGDGTVTDNVTGLMWQKTPGGKVTWEQAVAGASTLNLAGSNDWRLPTIKELYSLILFSGTDPSGPVAATDPVPFLDTRYFDFEYGDESAGERIIDAQYWSATEYVSTTMNGQATTFGVNFADGRIKGYGRARNGGRQMQQFVRYVRGASNYGENDFVDNGDGTITDRATGLMWQQADDGRARNWQEALACAEDLDLAGYTDWRLPNAKELQSIVEYTRSPSTTGTAAIDPVFQITGITNEAGQADYPCYWTGTTHISSRRGYEGAAAVYVAFGRAMGYMNGQWIDVHGAGAQRSEIKQGDPDDYPYGHGPQGDAVRIYNYVRCVRDAGSAASNNAPNTPAAPDGPGEGVTAHSYTFTTATTDPEGDRIYYLFDWGDGNNSGWLGPYDSGQTIQADHSWSAAGEYTVRAQARDSRGAQTPWSADTRVLVQREASPVSLSDFQVTVNRRDVLVQWRASTASDVLKYDVQRGLSESQLTSRAVLPVRQDLTQTTQYVFRDRRLRPATYYYRVKIVFKDGDTDYSTTARATVNGDIRRAQRLVSEPNYPNPFNARTVIKFSIEESLPVNLTVYNVRGERVTRLVNRQLPAGSYQYVWDGTGFSSGIYFYTIVAGDERETYRMLLLE